MAPPNCSAAKTTTRALRTGRSLPTGQIEASRARRFQVAFVLVAGPDRVEHRGWFTDLLEKRSGNWQLVWSQTTAVPNDTALFIKSLKPHA